MRWMIRFAWLLGLPACIAATLGAYPARAGAAVDWHAFADTARYHAADVALPPPAPGRPRIVFLGDSITDAWPHASASPSPHREYVNRGISGQTTPQMLLRFRADVLDLKPAAVVILAGTNDIAQNTGPTSPREIVGNIRSMGLLARAEGIRVILCSLLPTTQYPWRPQIDPKPAIAETNAMLHRLARRQHFGWVDYYKALDDGHGGLSPALSSDGVHPNAAGYARMNPLVDSAIGAALRRK
jgi:lysophospholipase L1-like esterase